MDISYYLPNKSIELYEKNIQNINEIYNSYT